MAFYSPDGKKMEINEFVDFYSERYYLGTDKPEGFNNKNGHYYNYDQTSHYVEDEVIIPILDGHIESYTDFARLMAWKKGKIFHEKSTEEAGIQYHSDWVGCETQNPTRYNKEKKCNEEFDLQSFAAYIIKNRDELEFKAKNDPQECLRLLGQASPDGIGTVYLITIMFFLSHRKQPIYDVMVMRALTAYEKNLKPCRGEFIQIKDLPAKKDGGFDTVVEEYYDPYKEMLDSLERDGLKYDYKKERKADQALWVYGHGFDGNNCE